MYFLEFGKTLNEKEQASLAVMFPELKKRFRNAGLRPKTKDIEIYSIPDLIRVLPTDKIYSLCDFSQQFSISVEPFIEVINHKHVLEQMMPPLPV